MGRDGTSLAISDEQFAEQFRDMRDASSATTNTEFIKGLLNENENVEVRMDQLETVELEKTEEAKETRAMAVGILEAMQRTGIKEDVIDLIEELRKREMTEESKLIVHHFLDKSKADEPLNEADRALMKILIETENARDEGGSAATAIAEGLFGELEETEMETTTTETSTNSRGVDIDADIDMTDEES